MTDVTNQEQADEPGLFKWAMRVAASAGLAGMLCCVAPMVLFMVGLMGGAYAISFANFFYQEDGSPGTGAWILRGVAVLIGVIGFWLYRRQQNQCSTTQKKEPDLSHSAHRHIRRGFFPELRSDVIVVL